jgi:hypothetical protein
MMHRVPQAGLTLPAVAGRGLSKGLGLNRGEACLEGLTALRPKRWDADLLEAAADSGGARVVWVPLRASSHSGAGQEPKCHEDALACTIAASRDLGRFKLEVQHRRRRRF